MGTKTVHLTEVQLDLIRKELGNIRYNIETNSRYEVLPKVTMDRLALISEILQVLHAV